MNRNNRVEQWFYGNHQIDRNLLDQFEPEDIEKLRAMVIGREASPNRTHALNLFTAIRPPNAHEILGEVLVRPDEDTALRAAAATHLGRLGGKDAEQILLKALADTLAPLLQTKIAAALGRTGTEEALARVQDFAQNGEPTVRKQFTLAALLISHRYGISGYAPRLPDDVEYLDIGESTAEIAIERTSMTDSSALDSFVTGDSYGLNVSVSNALALKCGPNDFVLAFEESYLKAGLVGMASQRPLFLGILAARAPEDGSYSASRFILVGPDERKRAYVAVYRTDGGLMHYGTGRGAREQGEFELRSLNVRGNIALELNGQINEGEITFTRSVVGLNVIGKQSPERFVPPTD